MANPFLTEVIESIMILVFEFLGTLLLTCLYMSTASWAGCPGAYNTDSVGDFDGGYVGFFIGFFILLVFSARISGSHYNPGVTLAFMFRKDTGRFSRWLGLAYILAQCLGAFCGGFLAYYVFGAQAWIGVCNTQLAFQVCCMETLGSFVLVFLYLSQTEEKTKLSNDPAITTAIIAASYLTAITLGYSSQNAESFSVSPLNFAVSLAQITMMTFNGNMSATSYQWIYLTFNWLGSILAVLAYELIFRKAESAVEARDDQVEEEHAERDNEEKLLAAD